MLALSYLFGGLFAARKGMQSLLTLSLDVDFLMVAAAIGAASIGHWWEGAVLMFLYPTSGALEEFAELRTRREGDRFEPLGMNGQVMKLSDFFINAKLPQRARDRWPLLCMGDIIVWIPGYRPAHPFRLTENTRQVLYFALMRG